MATLTVTVNQRAPVTLTVMLLPAAVASLVASSVAAAMEDFDELLADPDSYVAGDLLVATGPRGMSRLAAGVAGLVLLATGVGASPAYGKVTSAHIDASVATAQSVTNEATTRAAADTVLTNALAGKSDVGHTHAFSDLTGKPTTLVGYGITDAASLTAFNTHTADTAAHGATSANTASRIVSRDASGDFSARFITADLIGNADTASEVAVADVTGLLSGGKIATGLLPALAITDTFVVASQVAMLALGAETGDVAVRTDLNQSFILRGADPAVLADWQQLLTPTDAVLSVAGKVGAVTLVSADITDAVSTNTANRLVLRDASGNFAAGAITAALVGNASTATALATARTINGVAFDGSTNIDVGVTWAQVSKTGSSLADLATRSAGDLSSGNLAYARMPTGNGSWDTGAGTTITITRNLTVTGTLTATLAAAAGSLTGTALASNVVTASIANILGNLAINTTSAAGAKLHVAGSLADATTTGEVVMKLTRKFASGVSYPQVADFVLGRYSTSGVNPYTRLDIKLKADSTTTELGDVTVFSATSASVPLILNPDTFAQAFTWRGAAGFMSATPNTSGGVATAAEPALIIGRSGVGGVAYGNYAEFLLSRYSVASALPFTQLDIKLTSGNDATATVQVVRFRDDASALFSGVVGIGNSVSVAAGIASTHKVTMSIGGVTYYLLASNV